MLTTRNLNTLDRMLTLDRVFDQALGASFGLRVWVPAMDVMERRDSYVVQVDLPGLSPEQVDLAFEKNVLTIRGTKPASFDATTDGELRIFAAERVSGSFERSVRLPDFVNADGISASFANGLLTVTVPKAEAAQPRKISIKRGDSSRIAEQSE